MQYLRTAPSGAVEAVFPRWRATALTAAEQAAAYEEWADFYEWLFQQQAAELAGDPTRRHLVAVWTDSMSYLNRRLSVYARGDDPGEWVPQHRRRPDLDDECRSTAGNTAGHDGRGSHPPHDPDDQSE